VGGEGWKQLPEPAKQLFRNNGPVLLAELRGGYPDVTKEQLATIDKPTPSVRVEWVEGGHAIDPAHAVVLDFLDEVLAG
jgi:hypothetical protein